MKQNELARSLGFRESLALVVGTIIGTGIFLKTAVMSQTLGSPLVVLLAWLLGGALSLAGALTYAELGSLFPKAGGEFVYLKEAYGKLPAFLFGWMRFWIASPGSIAAYGVGAATFLGPIAGDAPETTRVAIAILFVAIFTGLNCLAVKAGGAVQVVMTFLKVMMIATIVFGCFFLSPGVPAGFATPEGWTWQGLSAFGSATIAALWAYDGWNNLPMASGEVHDAQKNIPRALIVGTILILVIYGSVNLAYFHSLPFSDVLSAASPKDKARMSVATHAAKTFLGEGGIAFLSIAMVISALGAMHGSILTSSRIPFAMAKEKLFIPALAYVHPKTHTPIVAILVQGVWACVLAASGSFDQLTDYVVFGGWVFYAMCGAAVIVLRKKRPEAPRSYRVPGYPVLPVVFVAVATWLLVNTLMTSPKESGIGLIIIGVGVPVYFLFFRGKEEAAR